MKTKTPEQYASAIYDLLGKKAAKVYTENVEECGDPTVPAEEHHHGPIGAGVSLTQFYDDLNSGLHKDVPVGAPVMMKVSGGPGMMSGMSHPGAIAFKQKCAHECEKLKHKCGKHILLDIYCKILPLDQDYIDTHHHQMSHDIDCMLDRKGMKPMEYLRSCSEKTKAPLLEFVNRSIENIGKWFMEEEDAALKDAQANNTDVPAPEAPEVPEAPSDPETPNPDDTDDITNQLVDVKSDMEYDSFVDELKKKTIDKIVADVSDIIADKKDEQKMEFDPKPIADEQAAQESAISVGIDYLTSKFMKENVNINSELNDEIVAMAIRESTLNQLDVVFKQPGSDDRSLHNRLRLGKGNIINESTAGVLMEYARHI